MQVDLKGKKLRTLAVGGSFAVCLGEDFAQELSNSPDLEGLVQKFSEGLNQQEYVTGIERQLMRERTVNSSLKGELYALSRESSCLADKENQLKVVAASVEAQDNEIEQLKALLTEERAGKEKLSASLTQAHRNIIQLRSTLSQEHLENEAIRQKNNRELNYLNECLEGSAAEQVRTAEQNIALMEKNGKLMNEIENIQYAKHIEIAQKLQELEEDTAQFKAVATQQKETTELKSQELTKQISQLQSDYKYISQQKIYWEETAKSVMTSRDSIKENLQTLETDHNKRKTEATGLTVKLETANKDLAGLLARERNDKETELALQQANRTLLASLNGKNNEIARFMQEHTGNLQRIERLRHSTKELTERNRQATEENLRLREEISALEAKHGELFVNLQQELAQKSKAYREKTLTMLNTPSRSLASPLLSVTPPPSSISQDESDQKASPLELL